MKLRILLIIVLLYVAVNGQYNLRARRNHELPPEHATLHCEAGNAILPHIDAKKYYICQKILDSIQKLVRNCDNLEYFDSEIKKCIKVPGGGEALMRNSPETCPENFLGTARDRKHSKYYFVCFKGARFTAVCPKNNVYDDWAEKCVPSIQYPTTIKIDESDGKVPVPNCRWEGIFSVPYFKNYYYICHKQYDQFYQDIHRCHKDTFFDNVIQKCINKTFVTQIYHLIPAPKCDYYGCQHVTNAIYECHLRKCEGAKEYDAKTQSCVPSGHLDCYDEDNIVEEEVVVNLDKKFSRKFKYIYGNLTDQINIYKNLFPENYIMGEVESRSLKVQKKNFQRNKSSRYLSIPAQAHLQIVENKNGDANIDLTLRVTFNTQLLKMVPTVGGKAQKSNGKIKIDRPYYKYVNNPSKVTGIGTEIPNRLVRKMFKDISMLMNRKSDSNKAVANLFYTFGGKSGYNETSELDYDDEDKDEDKSAKARMEKNNITSVYPIETLRKYKSNHDIFPVIPQRLSKYSKKHLGNKETGMENFPSFYAEINSFEDLEDNKKLTKYKDGSRRMLAKNYRAGPLFFTASKENRMSHPPAYIKKNLENNRKGVENRSSPNLSEDSETKMEYRKPIKSEASLISWMSQEISASQNKEKQTMNPFEFTAKELLNFSKDLKGKLHDQIASKSASNTWTSQIRNKVLASEELDQLSVIEQYMELQKELEKQKKQMEMNQERTIKFKDPSISLMSQEIKASQNKEKRTMDPLDFNSKEILNFSKHLKRKLDDQRAFKSTSNSWISQIRDKASTSEESDHLSPVNQYLKLQKELANQKKQRKMNQEKIIKFKERQTMNPLNFNSNESLNFPKDLKVKLDDQIAFKTAPMAWLRKLHSRGLIPQNIEHLSIVGKHSALEKELEGQQIRKNQEKTIKSNVLSKDPSISWMSQETERSENQETRTTNPLDFNSKEFLNPSVRPKNKGKHRISSLGFNLKDLPSSNGLAADEKNTNDLGNKLNVKARFKNTRKAYSSPVNFSDASKNDGLRLRSLINKLAILPSDIDKKDNFTILAWLSGNGISHKDNKQKSNHGRKQNYKLERSGRLPMREEDRGKGETFDIGAAESLLHVRQPYTTDFDYSLNTDLLATTTNNRNANALIHDAIRKYGVTADDIADDKIIALSNETSRLREKMNAKKKQINNKIERLTVQRRTILAKSSDSSDNASILKTLSDVESELKRFNLLREQLNIKLLNLQRVVEAKKQKNNLRGNGAEYKTLIEVIKPKNKNDDNLVARRYQKQESHRRYPNSYIKNSRSFHYKNIYNNSQDNPDNSIKIKQTRKTLSHSLSNHRKSLAPSRKIYQDASEAKNTQSFSSDIQYEIIPRILEVSEPSTDENNTTERFIHPTEVTLDENKMIGATIKPPETPYTTPGAEIKVLNDETSANDIEMTETTIIYEI